MDLINCDLEYPEAINQNATFEYHKNMSLEDGDTVELKNSNVIITRAKTGKKDIYLLNGKLIMENCEFCKIYMNTFFVRKNSHYGLISFSGTELIPITFKILVNIDNIYYAITDDNLTGAYSLRGMQLCPPLYNQIIRIGNLEVYGFFVRKENCWGIYSSKKQQELLPCQFRSVNFYNELLFNRCFVIENQDKLLGIYNFFDEDDIYKYYIVSSNKRKYEKYGEIIPCKFLSIKYSSHGAIVESASHLYGVYDAANGTEILPTIYNSIVEHKYGFILSKMIDSKLRYGFYNSSLKKITIPFEYDEINTFGTAHSCLAVSTTENNLTSRNFYSIDGNSFTVY